MTAIVMDQMRSVTVTSQSPTQVTVAQGGMQGPQGNPTTVNGHTGASITLTASDVGAIATSARGAVNGVASLDSSGLVPASQMPLTSLAGNFVDLSTNQTIATGIKTFSVSPVVPTPTTSTQAANKGYADLKLPLTGGTMSGAIAMGTNKITGVGNGSAAQDVAAFGQLSTVGGIFTTLGDTLYGGASGAGTRLAGNTTATRKFMRQTGTGSVSAAPVWDTLLAGDILNLDGVTSWWNVKNHGAKGDGATNDTSSIAATITAAQSFTTAGAAIYFPEGTYLVTPTSSTAAAFVLNNGTNGYQSMRFIGDSMNGSKLRRTAAGPFFSMSGPSTSSGATHCKYCSIENLSFDGNGFAGTMIQCYYADNLHFDHVYFDNGPDIIIDTAEFWDSRFYNCIFGGSGSTTSNAQTPGVLLRNSAAASGFGNSANNTNQIHFVGCRWEAFHTGALWIQQGVSNAGSPQQIYVTNCKMETSVINGGPHLLADANCQSIYVDCLYIYSGGFNGAYSTAQDCITWSAQESSIQRVFISSGTTATVANGVTLNSTVSGKLSIVRDVTGLYGSGGAPTGNHIAYGTGTGGFMLDNCNSNQTKATQYGADLLIVEPAAASNTFGSLVSGDTFKRWVSAASGQMSWGSGAAAADTVLQRGGVGNLATTKNFLIGSGTALGDNGVGVLELANATTVPTTSPTGGGVLYAKQAVPVWRDTGGNLLGMTRSYSADSTSNLASFTTEADVPGATVNVVVTGSNATVTIDAQFDFLVQSPAAATTMVGYLNWNGSDRTQQCVYENTSGTGRACVSRTWTITGVTAGTYVAKLRASCNINSANNSVQFPHTGINVQVTEG